MTTAIVPSKFIQSTLYDHEEESNLFNYETTEPIKLETSLENSFTGEEIQILIAIFKEAGFNKHKDRGQGFGPTAFFKSLRNLGAIAFNKPSNKLSGAEKKSLETVQQPRPIIFKERISGRSLKLLSTDAPIKISKTKNGIKVEIHSPWLKYSNSYKVLPLGIAELLRSTGVRIVTTPQIKFMVWCSFHLTNKPKSYDTSKIMKAIGLGHYFKNRNGHRARKILAQSIQTMHKLGFITEPKFLSSDNILLGAGVKVGSIDAKVGSIDAKVGSIDALAKSNILEFSTETYVSRQYKNVRKSS